MKTPAQIARHWGNFIAAWSSDHKENKRGYVLRDVGPYRVVIEDGKVIGHTLAEAK